MPQRFRRAKPETLRSAPSGPFRVGIVTAVPSGALADLPQQRRFLRDVAAGVTHYVVVTAGDLAAARELTGEDADVVLLEVTDDSTLGRARNTGARAAIADGCDAFITLGVGAIPLPGFLEAYREAFSICGLTREWLFNGPITYLRAGDDLATMRPARILDLVDPHPRRLFPPPGDIHVDEERRLLVSENFAVRAREWRLLGGFCDAYDDAAIGDLDLALRAEQAGFMMAWVGGAHVLRAPSPSVAWSARDEALFVERWGAPPPDQSVLTRTSA